MKHSTVFTILLLFFFISIGYGTPSAGFDLIPQTGHSGWIYSAVFTPDGKYMISGADDSKIILWDVQTGKAIRYMTGHKDQVRAVVVSSDGKRIASTTGSDIKIWDFNTGAELKSIKTTRSIMSLDFSPDCKLLAGGEQSYAGSDVYVFNPETGIEIMKCQKHFAPITSVKFSSDGKYLAATSEDKNVSVWDFNSKKIYKTFTGHTAKVISAAFSPDNRSLVSSSDDKTIRIWNLADKTEKLKITTNANGCEYRVHWSGKSIYMFVSIKSNPSWFFKQWDAETGKELSAINLEQPAGFSVLSPDGTKAAMVSFFGNQINLYDIAAGAHIRTFESAVHSLTSLALSPDGKFCATGNNRGYVQMWDIQNLRLVFNYQKETTRINSIAFSIDGKIFAFCDDKSIRILDSLSGNEIKKVAVKSIQNIEFTPDGKFLAGADNSGLFQWNLKNYSQSSLPLKQGRSRITFSRDGKYAASRISDNKIAVYDMNSKKELWTSDSYLFPALRFSPDGKLLAAGGIDVWEVATGKKLSKGLNSSMDSDIDFSPDGQSIMTSVRGFGLSYSGSISTYNTSTYTDKLNPLYQSNFPWDPSPKIFMSGLSEAPMGIRITPDCDHIVAACLDGVLRLYNLKTKYTVTMLAGTAGNWLAIGNDGYWDGSVNGGELIAMTRDLKTFTIDQFAIRSNRPDLLLKNSGIGTESLIEHYAQQYQKRLRRSGFTEDDLSSDIHLPEAEILENEIDGKMLKLKFTVSDDDYKLKKYNIYVNDVPIFGSYGKDINKKSKTLTEQIELTGGMNKVEVSCTNVKGAESYRALTYADCKSESKGDLYYIGFGISTFNDSSLNLKYADKDAKDLADLYSDMKDKYGKITAKTYLNEEVTVDNIKKAKELLKDAKPDDTFVLFIAGHGVHDTDKEATYYYLTYNADRNNLSGSCADFDLIEDLLQGIAPRNKLFLMDTCESGEIEDNVQNSFYAAAGSRGFKPRSFAIKGKGNQEKQTPEKRTYLYQKDRYIYNDLLRRSGAIVFSSSKGGEFSYESDKIKNGFFTKEIITAVNSKAADKNDDGVVSTDELREFVAKNVAKATGELQHPTVDRDNLYQKFGFPAK